MYCEHIDNETKQIFGLTAKQYDGYIEVNDIEQAYNGSYYIKGYAPAKPQEIINQQRIAELEEYLKSTDWYAIRFADTGEECPAEIKAKRQEARDEISQLRGE